jgi:trans-aconitate 2-methyltransferase
MRWDPQQYSRYAHYRARPFHDLVARIGASDPRRVVDLGCGSGELTAELAARWPDATVSGLDSSPEMIERARAGAAAASGIDLHVGDVTQWRIPTDCDVVVSNAVLQWVPTHRELLRRWAAALPTGGWLAVQVPGNFASPSHSLMRELAESPRWARQCGGVLRHADAVDSPQDYAGLLLGAGLAVDAWETTYLHVLHGSDPVLEWVRGTGLRPVLAALNAADAATFEAEYAAALRESYPPTEHGTVFGFRRIFAVAHKPYPLPPRVAS